VSKRHATTARRYERRGYLAIEPQALLDLFFVGPDCPENEELPQATVVRVRGPLDQHDEGWFDSYEAITARVAAACESSAPAIVLLMDSPGGEASGVFECARNLRAMADMRGKRLIAYVEGHACSACYALACGAHEIIIGDTSLVGSIGILSTRDDISAANMARGINVAFIASGARKADGHPEQPLSEAEVAAAQKTVDSLALVFFELVAEMRGMSVDDVAGLQAGVLHGQSAIDARLADSMQSYSQTLATLASTNGGSAMGALQAKAGSSAYQKAREALTEAAEGDDANAQAARAALALLSESDGGGDDDDADKDKDKDKDSAEGDDKKPDAEGDEKKPDAEGDEKKPDASSALRAALKAQTEVAKLRAELAAERERAERDELIASHAGLDPAMVALLKKSPLALVKETLAELGDVVPAAKSKAPTPSAARAAAAPGTKPTQGAPADVHGVMLPTAESDALKLRMGLTSTERQIVNTPDKLRLGQVVPLTAASAASAPVKGVDIAQMPTEPKFASK
jgi:ClpP class serine protease